MCDPYCCSDNCCASEPSERSLSRSRRPQELKGGIFSKCDCILRNGLQDKCAIEDCSRPTRTITSSRRFQGSSQSGDGLGYASSEMETISTPKMQSHTSSAKPTNGPSYNGLMEVPSNVNHQHNQQQQYSPMQMNQSQQPAMSMMNAFMPQSYPLTHLNQINAPLSPMGGMQFTNPAQMGGMMGSHSMEPSLYGPNTMPSDGPIGGGSYMASPPMNFSNSMYGNSIGAGGYGGMNYGGGM